MFHYFKENQVMTPQVLGILIGGLLPAVFYGLSTLFSKASTKEGIGIGVYLMITGVAIVLTGVGFFAFQADKTVSVRSAAYAGGFGVLWAIGTGLVAIGLTRFGIPLGKLVPLYNMNTLIAVLLALWIFSEWQNVKVTQLLLGAFLIVIGGIFVAKA
jgi:hypothetical protein